MTNLWPGCARPGPQGSRHTGLFILVLAYVSYSLRTVLVADFGPSSQESGPSTHAVWIGRGSSQAPGYGDAFVDALIAWLLWQE